MSDITRELLVSVVASLRDAAAKNEEVVVEKRIEQHHDQYLQCREPREVEYSSERYPKAWMTGRLIGMADMLDSFLKLKSPPGHKGETV